MITIDYRETELLQLFQKDSCKSDNLIHGDIMISTNDDDYQDADADADADELVETGFVNVNKPKKKTTNFYIIERKTLADLSSSIKDSRFREQKSRLLSVYPSNKIIYIIENSKRTKFMLAENILRSAILNLSLKHSFTVFHSKDPKDTAQIIKDIEQKMISGDLCGDNYGICEIGYTPIKKSKIINDNYLACQLATIPGVSRNLATILQNRFKSMKLFIDAIIQDKSILENIQMTENRKIGKKLSEKIINAVF